MSLSSSTLSGGRIKYKIIFLGDRSVGKSSIIERYIKSQFVQGQNPTVGIDFHSKNVSRNGNQYKLQLWDTAGQQRFRSLIPNYMRDANCAIIVYDITRVDTLNSIRSWQTLFSEHCMAQAVRIIVGNKIDMNPDRKVNKKDAQNQANRLHFDHMEVSAKSGKNLQQLFGAAIDLITKKIDQRTKLHPPQQIIMEDPSQYVQKESKHMSGRPSQNRPQTRVSQSKLLQQQSNLKFTGDGLKKTDIELLETKSGKDMNENPKIVLGNANDKKGEVIEQKNKKKRICC